MIGTRCPERRSTRCDWRRRAVISIWQVRTATPRAEATVLGDTVRLVWYLQVLLLLRLMVEHLVEEALLFSDYA